MWYFVGPTVGKLDNFSDNCVWQNKNMITIWFILWILYTVFFTMQLCFLDETKSMPWMFFSIYWEMDIIYYWILLMKNLKLRLQIWILRTSGTTTLSLFVLFAPSSGSVTRTHIFSSETCDENNILLQLKYHLNVQTRSKRLVKIAKMFIISIVSLILNIIIIRINVQLQVCLQRNK